MTLAYFQKNVMAGGGGSSLFGDRLAGEPGEHFTVGAVDLAAGLGVEVPGLGPKCKKRTDRSVIEADLESHGDERGAEDVA